MLISDWSSDVFSSDLAAAATRARVSALTPGLFRKARETVDCETPARSATSNDVGRSIYVPLDGGAGRPLSPRNRGLSIRGGGPADSDRQAVIAGAAVPTAPELTIDQRAGEAGAEALAVEQRGFGKAARKS